MGLTAKTKFTGLPIDQILQQITAEEMEVLRPLKGVIQQILVENIGTQYFSLADLKVMHHPYKIGGPGGTPKGMVNLQTGEFFSSLIIRGPLAGRDRNTITIFSRGGKELGNWLLYGTKRMQGRPWTMNLYTKITKATDAATAELTKRLRVRVKV